MEENQGEQHANGVKQSLEKIIGSDLGLKRKRKTEEDIQREIFEKFIIKLEQVNVRTALLGGDFNIDFSKYDEEFYEVIDSLILLHFGKEAAEVIFFYVYERINPDGSINELRDSGDNVVPLNSIQDLWVVVNNVMKQFNKKK
jgi:hypothetical protein